MSNVLLESSLSQIEPKKIYTSDGLTLDEFVWLLRDYVGRKELDPECRTMLIMFKSRGKNIWMDYDLIMDACGIGGRDRVKNHLNHLESAGWLTIDHGTGTTINHYQLTVPESVVLNQDLLPEAKKPEWLRLWSGNRTTVVRKQDYLWSGNRTTSSPESGLKEKKEEKMKETTTREKPVVREVDPSLVPPTGFSDLPPAIAASLPVPDTKTLDDGVISPGAFAFPVETTPVVLKQDYYKSLDTGRFYLAEGNPAMGSLTYHFDEERVIQLTAAGMIENYGEED